MEETPAERFRRLSRSLEETGDLEDAEAQNPSEPASSASSAGGAAEGEPGSSTAAAGGESPAPEIHAGQASGEGLKNRGGESPAETESEARPDRTESGEPATKPRVPHWRVRRRISRTGQRIRFPEPPKPPAVGPLLFSAGRVGRSFLPDGASVSCRGIHAV
jgi:hypothetical protein